MDYVVFCLASCMSIVLAKLSHVVTDLLLSSLPR